MAAGDYYCPLCGAPEQECECDAVASEEDAFDRMSELERGA